MYIDVFECLLCGGARGLGDSIACGVVVCMLEGLRAGRGKGGKEGCTAGTVGESEEGRIGIEDRKGGGIGVGKCGIRGLGWDGEYGRILGDGQLFGRRVSGIE